MKTAIEICTEFERILKPLGWHVGLTGSHLYGDAAGGGSMKDIDLIIYPHIEEDGSRSALHPEFLGKEMGILNLKNSFNKQYAHSDKYIWIGELADGRRVDLFFLTP